MVRWWNQCWTEYSPTINEDCAQVKYMHGSQYALPKSSLFKSGKSQMKSYIYLIYLFSHWNSWLVIAGSNDILLNPDLFSLI